jgi:DNA invertase Pin-like site-specific DNA recombinase
MAQHNGKFVAYYRVSTLRQGQSGLGIDAQRKTVSDFLNGGNWSLVEEFVEVESGSGKKHRPQLEAAIAACKKHKATLIVAKLDRLYRNVHFVTKLMEDTVKFKCCDMPEANNLTIHILAAVAEHEREVISERTKVALAALKARGVELGSPTPEIGSKAGNKAKVEKADKYAFNVKPIINSLIESGSATTLREIAKALQNRGIKTPRGGEVWHPSQVSNIMKRGK